MDNETLYTFTSNKPLSKEATDVMHDMAAQIRTEKQKQLKQQFDEKMDELERLHAQVKIIHAQSDMLFYRWIMADSNVTPRDKFIIIGRHCKKREAEANEEEQNKPTLYSL